MSSQLYFRVLSFIHLAGMLINSLLLNMGSFPRKRLSKVTSFAEKANVTMEHLFPIISITVMLQAPR